MLPNVTKRPKNIHRMPERYRILVPGSKGNRGNKKYMSVNFSSAFLFFNEKWTFFMRNLLEVECLKPSFGFRFVTLHKNVDNKKNVFKKEYEAGCSLKKHCHAGVKGTQ
jgi:hypothetical protein